MPSAAETPLFSIIIATRDRPQLFKRAAASVLSQSHEAKELIVVMDGSHDPFLEDYETVFKDITASTKTPIHIHKLIHREKGHGQSYSFNHGVLNAAGTFVTFLDDDDEWCDDGHLERVARSIEASGQKADYILTNQNAFNAAGDKVEPVWLEDLEPKLKAQGLSAFAENFYTVTIADLFLASGFCHLNTSIIRKSLYLDIGGMDEGVRWECDRDLFLRLIEAAAQITFIPDIISKHYIPNPVDKSSMTTMASMVDKRLFQLQVLAKGAAKSREPIIIEHCSNHLAFASRKLAEELLEIDAPSNAKRFAKVAQALRFSPFWLKDYLAKKAK